MPQLILWGRKWNFSSDEVILPAFCEMLIRVIWCIFIILFIIHFYHAVRDCPEKQLIERYIWGSFVFFSCSIFLDCIICFISLKGTITEFQPRQSISFLITIHFLFEIIQLGIALFGCTLVSKSKLSCNGELNNRWENVVIPIIIGSQFFEFFATVCCCTLVCQRKNFMINSEMMAEELWEKRCRNFCSCFSCCTCKLFGDIDEDNTDMAMIARILTDFFHHDGNLDLVPSDIAAGIILLRHQQRAQRETQQNEFQILMDDLESGLSNTFRNGTHWFNFEDRVPLNPARDYDRKIVQEIIYFSDHALAIYTWMLFIYRKPCLGIFKLCKQCCCLMNGHGVDVDGDNICHFHEASLLVTAGLDQCNLLYARFHNNVHIRPYCIIVDHGKQTVVISIRGTLSINDCITDALAEPESLAAIGEKWGFNGQGHFAHSGMATSAVWIREDIERHQIIHSLFGLCAHNRSTTNNSSIPLNQTCVNYNLLVVGHSLGAGAASLLTILLRPTFPNVRCIAYSPPGGLLSLDIAQETQEYITSVVLGNDIIPRLASHTIKALRDEVLKSISTCKANKLKIFRSLTNQNSIQQVDLLFYAANVTPETKFSSQLKNYQSYTEKRNIEKTTIKLYPPGKLIHLVKYHQEDPCCAKRLNFYAPSWANKNHFQTIIVSSTMMIEHFPDRVRDALHDLKNQWSEEF